MTERPGRVAGSASSDRLAGLGRRSRGDGTTSAPNVSMKIRRYGFCSYDAFTMKTWQSIPKNRHAIASAEPHCPAPVSVAIRFVPASLL